MANRKGDMQKDVTKLLEQTKEKLKIFGKELSVLAKKGEKELVKASQAGKIQFDIMGLGVQKEKIYYDLGKKVASLMTKKDLGIEELKPYWKKIQAIERDSRKKKRELSVVRKGQKNTR